MRNEKYLWLNISKRDLLNILIFWTLYLYVTFTVQGWYQISEPYYHHFIKIKILPGAHVQSKMCID